MISSHFEYTRAESAEQAVSLLAEDADAKLLAGGHSLVPLIKLGLAQPTSLIDITRLDELRYIRIDGDEIAIGPLTEHHAVEATGLLRERSPLLARAAGMVGDPQVRHRGTIGGSIAHGDPASDMPAVLLALDATFSILGPHGRRDVPASDFFLGFMETALRPDEMLVEIRVAPEPRDSRSCYLKFNRRAQDWATVGVAAVVRSYSDDTTVAIALTNMGSTPLRATAVERRLREAGDQTDIEAAADLAAEDTSPPSDTNGSSEYRRHLAKVLTRRALEQTIRSPN